jgi:hypothetical protein
MPARLILGQRGAGEWGMWVSKPGVDVWSASGDNLLFGPDVYNGVPILTGTITSPGTITHGLGYVPFCLFSGDTRAPAYNSQYLVTSVTTSTIVFSSVARAPIAYAVWARRVV